MEALGVNEDMLLVMGMVIGFSGLGQVRLTQIWMAVFAFVLKSSWLVNSESCLFLSFFLK